MSLRYLRFLPLLFPLFSCTSYQTGSGSAPVSDEMLRSVPVPPAADVVDSLLASMTIDEKVGQMLMVKMPGNYVSTQGNEFERLRELIADVKPGGMILLQGDVYETAMLLNKLQRLSRLPLLVGADLENGLAMRLRKATWFPSAMAVGATRSPAYAYAIGRATADEARAVGIHQNYAPVVDINTNPDNPIINTRAYSDEPGLVDTMAGAYIRGLQEGGVIATLKHFPGHGSAGEDSHIGLPVITFDRKRLDSLELTPFRSGIDSGAMSVMVGHMAVPALDPTPELPASLSPRIVSGILRGEMNFHGLIVTDAMDMAGVRGTSPGRAAVMAVRAGVDMLLMTTGEENAARSLTEAVRKGELAVARIDSSVRKILAAKERLGLFSDRLVDPDRIADHVGTMEHWSLARQVARDAVTIIKNEQRVIPLRAFGRKHILSLLVSDVEDGRNEINRQSNPLANEQFGTYFTHLLHRRRIRLETLRLTPASNQMDFDEALRRVKKSDIVLVSFFVKVRSASGQIGLPQEYRHFIRQLRAVRKPMVAIAFGNPYLVGEFPRAQGLICAYGDAEANSEAVADALFGECQASGKLPVSIPGAFPFGAGLRVGQSGLQPAEETQDGSSPVQFHAVDSLIASAIADSAFPGAQLVILRDTVLLVDRAYGKYTYGLAARPVDRFTLFDLASLTKVFATTAAVMKLYDEGKISLDDRVVKYIPGFIGKWKERVTIRQLLLHRGGLPPFRRLYEIAATEEEALDSVFTTPLVAFPGDSTIYSDLGMITLGKVVEQITGRPLDQFVQEEFYLPLGMTHTMFDPPPELHSSAAPTEYDALWRKTLVQGTVHDENAATLGGVAGHAGLFSTASDLARFVQMLLNRGTLDGRTYLRPSTVDEFIRKKVSGQERWLGWDMKAEDGSSAGTLFPSSSFGHTGFTGTSVWADPDSRLAVIFLTNRVYPTRANTRLYKVRPLLHDAIMRAIEKPKL
jgi:beta-N-acetylhexosaminidase